MYIQSVEITNIKSISHFKMDFKSYAGWHVLIGDNGAGKSSIIRAIAITLVGLEEYLGLRLNIMDWLRQESNEGKIHLELLASSSDIRTGLQYESQSEVFFNEIFLKRENFYPLFSSPDSGVTSDGKRIPKFNWGRGDGWFSVAYGPFRRFAGGNPEWSKVFKVLPKLGAHLSAFGEDVALAEALDWLVMLQYEKLEGKKSGDIIDYIKRLINSEGFLPHHALLERVGSEGVFFKDGNGAEILVDQLSDGYRSILSMTFELIRQLVRVYGGDRVFEDMRKTQDERDFKISLPGIVLIDEIDAHIHPTWQTGIGQWFTKYFPNIQFIVTTHSPLICRACENGSIWRLAAPGSEMESGEITGTDRDRLIYGNILDAYGTEVFGEDVSTSDDSVRMREEMVRLGKKKMVGNISVSEEKRLDELRKIFTTDDPIEL